MKTMTTTNNQNTTTKELEKMLSIEELHNALELDENGYGRDMVDYSGDKYVSDAISNIADNYTAIYYCDIIKFIGENVEEVNDAITEFGWDGCGGDLYKAGQMAQFLQIERDLYNNLEDILKHYALEYYKEQTGAEMIPADLWDELETICCGNVDKLEEITDAVDDYLKDVEEEEGDAMA